ncbi:heavy-metal-associated domain-containing protein [Flavobacterium weaverense]|uniref:Copper chaperone CopZ n=1 Tax=Flavobacterium weaverense TaxID=271156 RepID=A0A3L9ZU15_9FLAO|nr:heavy metal-associated domain-containing protein [Flavobacterium weaverense]RMA75830.1 copper chaperone CopZ [Flavobacterium weaverense]
MKIVNIKYSALIVLMVMFSAVSNAQISKAEIVATGLTCSMCSNAINKQLKSMTEVKNVEIDLNSNTFIVSLADNNSLSPSIFKEKVEKAGFFIGSLIVTVDAETLKKNSFVVLDGKESKNKEVQIQVLDKGYVTDKEFKKLSKTYKNSTNYAMNNEKDFHIKIVK